MKRTSIGHHRSILETVSSEEQGAERTEMSQLSFPSQGIAPSVAIPSRLNGIVLSSKSKRPPKRTITRVLPGESFLPELKTTDTRDYDSNWRRTKPAEGTKRTPRQSNDARPWLSTSKTVDSNSLQRKGSSKSPTRQRKSAGLKPFNKAVSSKQSKRLSNEASRSSTKRRRINESDDEVLEIPRPEPVTFALPIRPTASASAPADGNASDDSEMEIPYTQGFDLHFKTWPVLDQTRKEPLRPGDVICYSHPAFVAGTRDAYRRARVWETKDSRDELAILLVLDNGECLPPECRVKRVQEYRQGQVNNHEGIPRPIENFLMKNRSLPEAERERLATHETKAAGLRRILAETKTMIEGGIELETDDDSSRDNNDSSGDESDKGERPGSAHEKSATSSGTSASSDSRAHPTKPWSLVDTSVLRETLDLLDENFDTSNSPSRTERVDEGCLRLSLSKHNQSHQRPQKRSDSLLENGVQQPIAGTSGRRDAPGAPTNPSRKPKTLAKMANAFGGDDCSEEDLPPSVFSKLTILSRANTTGLSQTSALTQEDNSDDDLPPSVFRSSRSIKRASDTQEVTRMDRLGLGRQKSFLNPPLNLDADESDDNVQPSALCFGTPGDAARRANVKLSHRQRASPDSDASTQASQSGGFRQRAHDSQQRTTSFLKMNTSSNDVPSPATKQAQIEEYFLLVESAKDGPDKIRAQAKRCNSTASTTASSIQVSKAGNNKLRSIDEVDSDGRSDDESYFAGRVKKASVRQERKNDTDSITTTFTSSQSLTQSDRPKKKSKHPSLSQARRPFQRAADRHGIHKSQLEVRERSSLDLFSGD